MQEKVLKVGEVYASRDPIRIRTVLGSCIATCLFDPVTGVGGMNHFMLPKGGADKDLPARYGMHAMELLITAIMKLGGDRRRLQAKVFGGGHVLGVEGRAFTVPEANIQFAKEFLKLEQMPIRGLRVGGDRPVVVHFYPQSGRAFVKTVGEERAATVAMDEARYQVEVIKQVTRSHRDTVTLF